MVIDKRVLSNLQLLIFIFDTITLDSVQQGSQRWQKKRALLLHVMVRRKKVRGRRALVRSEQMSKCNLLFFFFQWLGPHFSSNTSGRRKPEIRAGRPLSIHHFFSASATLSIHVEGHFVSLAMPLRIGSDEGIGTAYL